MIGFVRTRFSELSDVLTVNRGIPTQASAPVGELPVLSVADLRSGASAKRFVDRSVLREAGIRIPQPGDVLISLEGAAAGDSFVIPEGCELFAPSQQVAVVHILDRGKMDPWYLGAWLATEGARAQLRRLARGAAVQRIPLKDLDTLIIPISQFVNGHESTSKSFLAFQTAIKAHRDLAECLESMCALMVEMNFDETFMIELPVDRTDQE